MALRKPIVYISGIANELPPGDNVEGAVSSSVIFAGSGLSGGGSIASNVQLDVNIAPNPSGLIFVGDFLGIDGSALVAAAAAQTTANAALASGNAALSGVVAGGGASYTYTLVSGTKTLTNKERALVVNSGTLLILPGSPTAGAEVGIAVISGVSDTVISGNQQFVMGSRENLTINFPESFVSLAYVNSTFGWRMF